jgi:heme-degrading monooxygenase HmoA
MMKTIENTNPVYVIVWEFRPKAGREREFETAYGSEGAWAKFFKNGTGYIGTVLHRDVENDSRYLTIDYWVSQEAYESFRNEHNREYEELDRKMEHLTEHELESGTFYSILPSTHQEL